MLRDFKPTKFNPDNRHKFLEAPNIDELVIGATNKHVFKLDFLLSKYKADVDNYASVVYKQSITPIFTKDICPPNEESHLSGITISEYEDPEIEGTGKTFITVEIFPDESYLFKSYRNCFAQLKLKLIDNTISYSGAKEIIIRNVLENEEESTL